MLASLSQKQKPRLAALTATEELKPQAKPERAIVHGAGDRAKVPSGPELVIAIVAALSLLK